MRKIFVSVAVFSTLFAFASCSKEQKKIELVMAEPNPEGSISAKVDHEFAYRVEELSKGSIKIQVHASGVLGDNSSVLAAMVKPGNSGIHLARLSPIAVSHYNCPNHSLLNVPYTFKNHEHFWKFANSPVAEKILNEPYTKKVGVKGLFFMEEGFRHFFSTKPLNDIEDFAGENIRSAGNPIMEELAVSLKAFSKNVPFTSLYAALQTGEVTIAEQPIINYLSNDFNRVAPYMILDGHEIGVAEVVISSELWKSLTKEQQNILIEAGKYAGEYCQKVVQESESSAKLTLRNSGTKFAEVKDFSKWQKVCADVISRAVRDNTEIYGEILNLAD
ncbi:MAG: TRAP transporter substrate-binding protein [Treponema sp.]|nr:TRAP transporter substrate-binding protein [Treponema sp.]